VVSAETPIFHETVGVVISDPGIPCSMSTCLDLVAEARRRDLAREMAENIWRSLVQMRRQGVRLG
jgi:hypothetical protein